MYLKIVFIFYLIHGTIIKEEIFYQKKDNNITNEEFEREVRKFESDFRQQLSNALIHKHNKPLIFGDTILSDTSLLAFKTKVEEVDFDIKEDHLSESTEIKNNFTGIQPFEFTVEEKGDN